MLTMYKIVEDLLPSDIFNRLVYRVKSADHWAITTTTNGSSKHESMGTVSFEYDGSALHELYLITAQRIAAHCGKTVDDMSRVRAGLIWRDGESKPNDPHVDMPSEFHTTALLYLNDTDGDTYFYKENGDVDFQVSPKANKVIIFDGDMVHSSSTPTQTQYRIALNFNFAGKPNFCQN